MSRRQKRGSRPGGDGSGNANALAGIGDSTTGLEVFPPETLGAVDGMVVNNVLPYRAKARPQTPRNRALRFDHARFDRWFPLQIDDGRIIRSMQTAPNATERAEGQELFFCCLQLRRAPGHPQAVLAARIVQDVLDLVAAEGKVA